MHSQKDSKALAVRIHKTLAAGVIENLMQVLLQGRYADKVLAFQFKAQKKWGARDRAWVADQTYGLLRYLRRYSHYLEAPPATASDFWVLLAMHLHRQGVPLPAWSEVGHAGPYLQKMEQAGEEPRAVRESVPDWLDALAYGQMGAQWEPTLRALNVQAPVVLRTNILKTTRTKLIAALQGEGIVAQPLGDHALVRLRELKSRHPLVGDVRGRGLLLGVELVDLPARDGRPAVKASDAAERIMYGALSRGLNFKVTMGTILTLTPALVLTQPEMDQAIDILDRCLTEVESPG